VDNNFDALVGSWDGVNRRLSERLTGCDTWEDGFTGKLVIRPALGGAGYVDEVYFPSLDSHGLTLCLYDAKQDEWSLYTAGSDGPPLEPPMVGRFVDGHGEFFCDDTYDGRAIRVRHTWTAITPTTARWEQAFSVDGGETWETNWIAEQTRTA
jgi:hypothetical protein